MPLVAVVMGSRSDEDAVKPGLEMLDRLGVSHEVFVMSAHRQPEKVREFAQTASERGFAVIIAAAGLAAHLPGVLAAWTTLPVIGLPIAAGALNGVDALYSIAQMPPGVPVAAVGIGNARNAALLAAQILGVGHPEIRAAYAKYRQELAQG